MNAEQRRIASIAEMAAKSFADHVVEVRLNHGMFRNWQCSKPGGGSFYLFNVSTEPGRLFVTGDIGTLVLEREVDMIAWARSAIGDPHYFESKAVREIKTKEFDPECAVEWVDDAIANRDMKPALGKKLKRMLTEYCCSHAEFCEELFNSGFIKDCDFPMCENFTCGFLWQREAIKWLLNRIPPTTTTSTPHGEPSTTGTARTPPNCSST